MDQRSLSILLPVTAAAGSLASAVAECLALAAHYTADHEIIIVDDASADGTATLADRLATLHPPVAVMHYSRRRGYRRALHDAWGAARGTHIIALDLGGPATAADIARLLPTIADHAAIFGYRVPPSRWPGEAFFAAAVRMHKAPGLRDPSLGLGLFRADLRDLLPPDGPDTLTHADIYTAARQRGLSIAQVAVSGKARRHASPSARDSIAALTGSAAPDERSRQGAVVGAGMLIAAGGLWLLRRWRRTQ